MIISAESEIADTSRQHENVFNFVASHQPQEHVEETIYFTGDVGEIPSKPVEIIQQKHDEGCGTSDAYDVEDNLISCYICLQKFSSKEQLDEHFKDTHRKKPEKDKVMCEICGKSIGKTSISTHRRIHQPVEKFNLQCQTCGKCFRTKSNLKFHQRRHERASTEDGVVLAVCDICGATMRQDCLKRHIKNIHEKKGLSTSKKVSKYDKSFKSNPLCDPITGYIIKTKPSRYECPHCPFVFKTYARRWQHMKEHKRDPEKHPFACSLCNIRFQSKGGLTNHLIDFHIKRGDNYVGAGAAGAALDLSGMGFDFDYFLIFNRSVNSVELSVCLIVNG